MDSPTPDSTQPKFEDISMQKSGQKVVPDSPLGLFGIPVPPENYSGMVPTMVEKPVKLEGKDLFSL